MIFHIAKQQFNPSDVYDKVIYWPIENKGDDTKVEL